MFSEEYCYEYFSENERKNKKQFFSTKTIHLTERGSDTRNFILRQEEAAHFIETTKPLHDKLA